MAMAMHQDSCLCVDNSLDFFAVPPTDVVSRSSFYSKVYPIGNVSQGGPIEYNTKSNKADFIDLTQTFLALKLKILKADGTPPDPADGDGVIPNASKVFPVNYLSGAMFKDVEVYIGNKLISNSDSHYAYKAYFESLLTYSKQVQVTLGVMGGFHKDDKDFNEVTAFDGTHNSGAKARFVKAQFGKSFQLICKIHNDIFNQGKKFPGDVPLKIRFIRNEENFCLMAKEEGSKYKIQIEDAVLHVKRATLDEVFLAELDSARQSGKMMKYPFKRVELKYSTQAPNKAILQENRLISNGELPKRIIMGLVNAKGWDGSLAHNPFYFQNFGVTDIVLQRGKEVSPFCELTKLDFDTGKYFEAYAAMVYATGRLFSNDAPGITPLEFKNGYALYCFDLSKNAPNSNSFELTESGTINVIVTLAEPVEHGIVMVFYNEYDSMLALGPGNVPEVISPF